MVDVAVCCLRILQPLGLHLLQPEAEVVTDLDVQQGGVHPRALVGCHLVLLCSLHLKVTGVGSALAPIRRPSAAAFLH